MNIGITFDLKEDLAEIPSDVAVPDDFQEEFDSPATIEAIASALRDLGHDVVCLGDGRPLLERLLADPPDFVFNIAEGQGISRSREARVPAVLEMLGIPYSGSDPLTLTVTLDKQVAKTLVKAAGIQVPFGIVIAPAAAMPDALGPGPLANFPAIVKPAWEGSSKGIRNKCLVKDQQELVEAVVSLGASHRQPILVEEFIQGDELTVGIVDRDGQPEVMGIMRVVPTAPTEHFVYGLEVKRDFRRQVRYECPAPYSRHQASRIETAALTAYHALGCRDVARVDFRLRDGEPVFLEVNPLPGLNPGTSDLVIMAELIGWSYAQLIRRILQAALHRHRVEVFQTPTAAT
jgi:D-alanine-D-alanine ligase